MKKNNDFWKSHFKKTTVLDPTERISEVLFGLIMVLTFTGTIVSLRAHAFYIFSDGL